MADGHKGFDSGNAARSNWKRNRTADQSRHLHGNSGGRRRRWAGSAGNQLRLLQVSVGRGSLRRYRSRGNQPASSVHWRQAGKKITKITLVQIFQKISRLKLHLSCSGQDVVNWYRAKKLLENRSLLKRVQQ